jgi:hypothetical protein
MLVTGSHARLTPASATALGALILMAAIFHSVRHESSEALLRLLLLASVLCSPWPLLPSDHSFC